MTTSTAVPNGARHTTTAHPATIGTTTPQHRHLVRRGMVLAALALVSVAAAGTAHADTQILAVAGSIDQVLGNIQTWVSGILAGLATLFLTIGGARYTLASGDPGEIEKAKTALKAAAIGYALALLAPLILTILNGFVG